MTFGPNPLRTSEVSRSPPQAAGIRRGYRHGPQGSIETYAFRGNTAGGLRLRVVAPFVKTRPPRVGDPAPQCNGRLGELILLISADAVHVSFQRWAGLGERGEVELFVEAFHLVDGIGFEFLET